MNSENVSGVSVQDTRTLARRRAGRRPLRLHTPAVRLGRARGTAPHSTCRCALALSRALRRTCCRSVRHAHAYRPRIVRDVHMAMRYGIVSCLYSLRTSTLLLTLTRMFRNSGASQLCLCTIRVLTGSPYGRTYVSVYSQAAHYQPDILLPCT